MAEVTLESLAARLLVVEAELAEQKLIYGSGRTSDWRDLVGMFEDNDFTRSWMAETEAIRLADRAEAASNPSEDDG